jgi:hypothetical protein
MIVYKSSTPRPALRGAAVAMAAVTMAVMVVLPAEIEAGDARQHVQAGAGQAPVLGAFSDGSVDVAESPGSKAGAQHGYAALATPKARAHPVVSSPGTRNQT